MGAFVAKSAISRKADFTIMSDYGKSAISTLLQMGYQSASLVNSLLTAIPGPVSQVGAPRVRAVALNKAIDAGPIAFRIGQIDVAAKCLLASHTCYSPEMRAALALHWLSRAWEQYRKDRAIALGASLLGAECTGKRNAFLNLVERALPTREKTIAEAIRTVRRIAIRPMASEARETETIVSASLPELDAVIDAVGHAKLPGDPLERLLSLVERFRYSSGDGPDGLTATARTPCWAINLAATARGHAFRLSETPLPFPGLVQRRLFRADRDASERRAEARESLLDALYAVACDIARFPRAADIFAREFPSQRSNSRLLSAWMLLFGLGAITPAQLARGLGATKAGAAKLLRQLEAKHMAHHQGPFTTFVCAITPALALPDWRYQAGP
tara:strand:- start:11512 stop:12672 length:1161 start_codon:yes stop_codon:yes gene_type:complete